MNDDLLPWACASMSPLEAIPVDAELLIDQRVSAVGVHLIRRIVTGKASRLDHEAGIIAALSLQFLANVHSDIAPAEIELVLDRAKEAISVAYARKRQ